MASNDVDFAYRTEGGEVCFYLSKTREQFRVRGRLQVVAAGEGDERLAKARRSQWAQISPAAQASFATSLIPGLEMTEEEVAAVESKRDEDPFEPPKEPLDAFCLVLLWPQSVDHLELKDGQRRHLHTAVQFRDPEGGDSETSNECGDEMQRHSITAWKTVAINP